MLIVCPNCATSYDVDVASLRPDGRRVRCVRCRNVWLAELSHADKLLAAAEALGPAGEAAAGAPGPTAAPNPGEGAPADFPVPGAGAPPEDFPAAPIEAGGWEPAREAPAVESPPIAPADFDAAAAEPAPDAAAEAGPLEDVETVAARRAPRRAKAKPWSGLAMSRLQWATLALIVIDAIVVGWRTDFVRVMPQTASFYAAIGLPVNLRGLSFDNVNTVTEQHDNVPILVLQGDIVNDTRKIAEVPRLRFAVRNAAHQEIYSWTAIPSRSLLPPGEAIGFRTRLASPPPDAHDVLIRFLNRYDLANGMR